MPRIAFKEFCGGSDLEGLPANGNYLPISAERSINLYPERTRRQNRGFDYSMIGRPALSQTGFATTINSPVRALWAGFNRLFAVGGSHFYELSSGGACSRITVP